MAGESRTELLAWSNDLLQLNYTKVEQFGSGAAYCQIIDSIYGDLPMSRVKFNARQEYEYLDNFKVLQKVFKSKKVDKPIPVDRLVKCKMQDNLEFLQWIRRFHDQAYPGGPYDAVGRRKGEVPAVISSGGGSSRSSGAGMGGSGGGRSSGVVGGPRAGSSAGASSGAHLQQQINGLTAELNELRGSVEGLETERDFYFAKLRDIEVIVQEKLSDPSAGESEKGTLTQIQEILYSTEPGFEVPEGELGELTDQVEQHLSVHEDETF